MRLFHARVPHNTAPRSDTIGATMPTAVDLLHTLAATPHLPGAACVDQRDVLVWRV